jgi:hypothetical protein
MSRAGGIPVVHGGEDCQRTWHCDLCGDVITGRAYVALMNHMRLIHPGADRDALWPDGTAIVDSYLELLEEADL